MLVIWKLRFCAVFALYKNNLHLYNNRARLVCRHASLAQLDRVPDYESVGWEFESPMTHHLETLEFQTVRGFLFFSLEGIIYSK